MWRYLRLWRLTALCCLAVVSMHPALLFGVGPELSPGTSSESPDRAPFALEVRDNRLSLKAEQASVKAILGAIGRQMQIEMVVRLRQDRHVTVTFSALPLQDALKRLGLSAATVIAKDRQDIAARTKIVVLDQGDATPLSSPASQSPDMDMAKRRAEDGAPGKRESIPFKIDTAPAGAAPFKLEIVPSEAPRKP